MAMPPEASHHCVPIAARQHHGDLCFLGPEELPRLLKDVEENLVDFPGSPDDLAELVQPLQLDMTLTQLGIGAIPDHDDDGGRGEEPGSVDVQGK